MELYFGLSFYFCIVRCCLSPLILLGNRITVVIVTRYLKRFTPTHVAVTYLAVADFTVGMMPWLRLITYLTQDFSHWRNWSTITSWIENVVAAQGLNAIMLVAVERYYLIKKWNTYQQHHSVTKQTLLSGITGLFLLLTPTIGIILDKVNPKFGKCYFALTTKKDIYYFLRVPVFLIISSALILSYM